LGRAQGARAVVLPVEDQSAKDGLVVDDIVGY
jgi:hypothetical protein